MNFTNASNSLNRTPQARGPRILVASEYPVEGLAIESLLRSESYHDVRVTTDAREIPPMHVRWPFDLLILDMHSKIMNPTAVMQSLAQPIRAGGLSVLALHNPGAEQERLAALAAGAVDTLSRPLSHENILPRIRQALSASPVGISSF